MPNLNLKNFAKVKDSDFDLKDITVFAGKPGSGKSYIMKFQYAFTEALSSIVNETYKMHYALMDNEDEKFNFIFRNILESTFGDINQINEKFNFSYEQTSLSYSDNKLTTNDVIFDENINGAIFVETPLILEFQKFLPTERFKVPYHIDSLLQELNKNDFSFTSEDTNKFIHAFRDSTSKIINGNIDKGAQGFSFVSDSGKNYNIVNASSGIKSIGLLQYLVTNKILKKGSTLFWEEPEVHLHPTWQLKMIDLFIELMNAGIKVVFSTHSPFMADYLNAKATKGKFGEKISFNLLSENDGVVSNTILKEENWNLLQDELLGSLEDIMWEYL